MEKLKLFCFLFLFPLTLVANSSTVELINIFDLPNKMKFKNSRIGGLSGLYYDMNDKVLYAVSDDRGRVNDPRFYEFNLENKKHKFLVVPKDVHFFTPRESKPLWRVLDLEGITRLPWGDFLFSSEGDLNQIPRQQPQLLDSKPDGKVVREYDIPEKFLVEKSGKQTKGIRNNNGWEGLAISPSGQIILAATEGSLVQDSDQAHGIVRIVQYETPEAWVIKPTNEYAYSLEASHKKDLEYEFGNGVSEILFDDESHVLVMERALIANPKEFSFQVKIFRTDLKDAKNVALNLSFKKTSPELLSKELFIDLNDFKKEMGGRIFNFEGMTWGPPFPDGSRLLILVTDDNFTKSLKTRFAFFKIKGKP